MKRNLTVEGVVRNLTVAATRPPDSMTFMALLHSFKKDSKNNASILIACVHYNSFPPPPGLNQYI